MHAIIRPDGTPEAISPREWWVDNDGFTHSPKALVLWTTEQLLEKGVHAVVDDAIPPGERSVSWSLAWDDAALVVRRSFVTEPIPPPDPEEVAAGLRLERDERLRQSDWTQLLDAPVDQPVWATYRASLRALPEQPGWPEAVEWPAEPWLQPSGAHDAYPLDARVTHAGKVWVSLVDANTWEPGVSGWREEAAGDTPAEWVQPSGSHDAYNTGDRVTFEGSVYESLIDANTWSPTAHPAGWELIP